MNQYYVEKFLDGLRDKGCAELYFHPYPGDLVKF